MLSICGITNNRHANVIGCPYVSSQRNWHPLQSHTTMKFTSTLLQYVRHDIVNTAQQMSRGPVDSLSAPRAQVRHLCIFWLHADFSQTDCYWPRPYLHNKCTQASQKFSKALFRSSQENTRLKLKSEKIRRAP